jgi:DNA polymerase epsilon subunit 4
MIVEEGDDGKIIKNENLEKEVAIKTQNNNLDSSEAVEDSKVTKLLDQILEDNQSMEEDEREIDNDEDIYNERSNLKDMKQENHTDDHTNNKNKDILNDKNQKESHRKEKVGFTRLPLAKIKNIMKLDGDVKLCQKNAYYVIGKLTELFLQELANNALSVSKISKRKTMNLEDIACAVKSIEKYNFLDVKTIFNVETIEDLKAKEEKFEKKMRQTEIKLEKKESKIEKINNKKNISAGNMKIDSMFFSTGSTNN